MNKANRSNGGWVACLALMGAISVAAQDWPQWRGANRDGKVTGFTAPQAWPKELTQKWKVTVGAGDASPALVGDKLYVFSRQGADEVTLCLSATDGKELWRNAYAAQAPTGPAGRHPGPRSSPAVADGKVVTLGVGGVLSCLDAGTGKVMWRKEDLSKSVPQFFTAMSPVIADGLCIAHLGGKDSGLLVALDRATGSEKWRWAGDGPSYASPVLMTVAGTAQVVVQTEKSVLGVAVSDGKRLWQVASPAEGRFYNSATPIVEGVTVIYTGQGLGTKAVKVEKQGEGFAAKELWSNADLGTAYNTPVLKDGMLFGLSDRGYLFCMNALTGQAAWTGTNKWQNFGSVVDAGPSLLALPSNAELIVLKPGDKEYAELARFKVADTPTYAHLVIAENRIFVKDSESLTLWTLP